MSRDVLSHDHEPVTLESGTHQEGGNGSEVSLRPVRGEGGGGHQQGRHRWVEGEGLGEDHHRHQRVHPDQSWEYGKVTFVFRSLLIPVSRLYFTNTREL